MKPTYEDLEQSCNSLRQQLEEFEEVIEQQNDFVVTFDRNYTIIFANQSYLSFFKKTLDEVRGKPFIPFIHQEDVELVKRSLGKLEKPPHTGSHRERVLVAGGTRWVEWSDKAILSASGKIEKVIAVGRDITRLVEAEQEIEELNRALSIAQDTAGVGYWKFDKESDTITWSERMFKIMGFEDRGTVPSYDELRSVIHPDDVAMFNDAVNDCNEHQKPYDVLLHILHKNGKQRVIRSAGRPVRVKNGITVELFGVTQDITAFKETDDALKQTVLDLQLAQRIGRIGNWTYDPAVKVPVWSDEIYRIYERRPKDGPPHISEYERIYDGDDLKTFQTAFQKAVQEGAPYDITLRLKLPFGRYKWIHAICEPEPGFRPSGHRLRGTIQDITDLKTVELELGEANRHLQRLNATKDKLFSVVAHDLRSPFQGILGYTEYLHGLLSQEKSGEAGDIAARLYRAVTSSYELLTTILEWARTHRETDSITLGEHNLQELIDESLEEITAYLQEKEVQFTTACADGFLITTDKSMLVTVLRNLLANAVKFSQPNSSIEISCSKKGGATSIIIKDEGTGIPPEKLQRLNNGDMADSSEGTIGEKGTGLGLLICREFLDRLEGSLTISSEEGTGTTVEILLQEPRQS